MEKLLFTELRVLMVADPLKGEEETKVNLERALVDNENLKSIGYTLKGEDVMKLARSYAAHPSMTSLYDTIKEFEPDIEADPMYPNFPIQMLEMSTLDFRVHQLTHYLTTYGFEDILGMEVVKGWLPSTEVRMERIEDKQVVDLKTLDLLNASEVSDYVIDNVISKRERLLPGELKIAKAAVANPNRKTVESIPFKENIGTIYGEMLLDKFSTENKDSKETIFVDLANILKHPGDVLDLIEELIKMNKYKHFRTSLKRKLVEMLESHSSSSFEENLASDRWSNTFLGKGGRPRAINKNVALIDYLSYNKFSKSPAHKEIVNKLKDGKLLSWNQNLERAYENGELDVVIGMLRERPGVYFRQINRLMKSGLSRDEIVGDMRALGEDLKTQSIVSALSNFDGDSRVYMAFYQALISNLEAKEIEAIAGKKVFLVEDDVDLSRSKIQITDKFEEGGYISNGIALKLPKDAKYLRFFTYWNDVRRVDIDLHAAYTTTDDTGHIGWNGGRKYDGLSYSGDITHSDAAEYIDIDLEQARESGVETVQFNINSYTGIKYKDIDTVFTGIMVLSEIGQEVELYDQKNVLFRHDLNNPSMATNYGQLDLTNGVFQIVGASSSRHNDKDINDFKVNLSTMSYLKILLSSQRSILVDKKEEADLIIGLAKSDESNYLSLIDENYFMD